MDFNDDPFKNANQTPTMDFNSDPFKDPTPGHWLPADSSLRRRIRNRCCCFLGRNGHHQPSLASGKGGGVHRKQRSKPKCRIVKSPSSAAFPCLSHLPCTYHSDPRA